MKTFVLLILIALYGFAAEKDPELFKQMSDPLYAFAQKSSSLENDPDLGKGIRDFRRDAAVARQFGFEAQTSSEPKMKQRYLQQLRMLEKKRDRVMMQLRKALMSSMKNEDFDRFAVLMRTEPEGLMKSRSFQKASQEFYKKFKGKQSIAYLDDIERSKQKQRQPFQTEQKEESTIPEESYREWANAIVASGSMNDTVPGSARNTKPAAASRNAKKPMTYREAAKAVTKPQDKHYVSPHRKTVIVLTTKTCPACKKAKKFFRDERINFREYDVRSSREGQRLYRQHNGHAVPMIIVGDKVMTGLNRSWFKNNYGHL